MTIPVEVQFRNITRSDALEDEICEKAENLSRFYDRIHSCRVVVEAHKHQLQGNHFNVKLEVRLPGEPIIVTHDPGDVNTREDPYIVLRDTFNAARRQLKDRAAKDQGRVKTPATLPTGTVARIFPNDDYGFIEATNGYDVYFHRHALLDGQLERLEVGTPVSFFEEEGDNGPQAASVHILKSVESIGEVSYVDLEKGYGFVESVDGYELYFDKDSVLEAAFGLIELGTQVSYLEKLNEDGGRARQVRLIQ